MLELILLASVSGIIGMAIRARLENEKPIFYIFHGLIIGIGIGLVLFFHYANFLDVQLTVGTIMQIFLFFAMLGYAVSDLLDSLIEIAMHPLPARRKKRK